MDRPNKNRTGKPVKSHHPFPGSGELIALGKGTKASSAQPEPEIKKPPSSKPSSSTSPNPSSKTSSSSSSSSTSKSGERKREAGSSSGSHSSPKKIRIQVPSVPGQTLTTVPSSVSASKVPYSSAQTTKPKLGLKREHSVEESGDIDPNDITGDKFLACMEKAKKVNDLDRAQALLLAGLKRLRQSKERPEVTLCLGLLRGSKMFGSLLRNSSSLEALCALITMKRSTVDPKTKLIQQNSSLFSPLAISMVCNSHDELQTCWPVTFVKVWVEDACSERAWVDSAQCKSFVDNLICSFDTKTPPSHLIPASDQIPGPPGGSSPSLGLSGDSDGVFIKDLTDILEENMEEISTRMRYNGMEEEIESIILDVARDIINKKAPEVPRNTLRALCSACGLSGVRAFVVSRLEQWIHNPKCGRQAQELLLYLCVNSHCNTTADSEIVLQISKLRIKTKPLANFYSIALKEMVRENEPNLRRVLHQVIHNELTPTRNTNNFAIFGSIMGSCSEAPTVLAEVFLDLLQKREDFLGALRLLFREIVRSTRHEFDLVLFVRGLLKNKQDLSWRDTEIRDRGFKAIVDLVIVSIYLALSPSVKEAAVVRSDSKKDLGMLGVFHKALSTIQEETLIWMYSSVPANFRPTKKEFLVALYKILLKDPANDLHTRDGWPTESEKIIFTRLAVETPLGQETLMWVLFQGFTKDHNYISSTELLDLVEFIIMRSATHSGVVEVTKLEIIEFLFRLCEYNHPENINLPVGYEPPKLAISKLYWRAWIILCVLSTFSPTTFGKVGWESYPTLKILMEMCMANDFTFPTAASAESSDDILGNERQVAALEKEQILEFETHLAAASTKNTITERTSLLLPQLMRLEPLGKARTPPTEVLSQLQSLNDQLHLGHTLCKSRNPDFLVDLIQRNSQPMPWLSELVSEGSFEILPIQCLCEFMFGQTERIVKAMYLENNKTTEIESTSAEKSHKKGAKATTDIVKDVKGLQLLQYLKEVVHGLQDDMSREVLEYFFKRLASKKMQGRLQAQQGIQLLLSSPKKPLDENWLLDSIPTLRMFSEVQASITVCLRNAIQVENEPKLLAHYLEFLSTWSNVEVDTTGVDQEALALDVAQLVVERNGVMSALLSCKPKSFDSLFVIFLNYIKKIREPHQETHKWSEITEQVLVQWPGEQLEASLNILIIHAIVILLASYATTLSALSKQQPDKKKSSKGNATVDLKYNELLDIWFPREKANTPKGFLLNTSEEAILYPDWIKLRMIRSNNSRQLSAALNDLDVDQLMLFVQSFGIPVKSMTALLYCVDTSVETNPDKVSSVIVDPQYMNTLVELQWKRGASGGEKFAQLLKALTRNRDPNESAIKESIPRFRTRPALDPETFIAKLGPEAMDCSTTIVAEENVRQIKLRISVDAVVSAVNVTKEDNGEQEEDIQTLSRQLLASAISASSTRRRPSLPLVDVSVCLTPRRHSSYLEQVGEKSSGDTHLNLVGELVDRIRDVEPCIVRNALDVQLPLLFGRNDNPPPCRSFLLTVLTHESGWDTIEQCLTLFLKEFDPSYDPSTILDLITSTIKNPKLWQGCDKYVPKHQPLQSVFQLNPSQLLVMAEYIVEEINQSELKNTKFSISNLLGTGQTSTPKNGKKIKNCLQQRVCQWLLCCNNRKEVVDVAITSLIEKKGRNPCTRKLISQVYLEFPEVILMRNWKEKSEDMFGGEDDASCILDSVSHTLITAVANVQSGKEWYRKVTNECEICLRKIASVHPILLLRQLPLMGALLEGRVHLEFSVFHSENHQVPFQVFLGLIDLMQPHVLKHFKILTHIFTLYIKLFKNFGQQRDYSATLGRFSVLLHNLLCSNPIEMKEFLGLHYAKLKELATVKYYVDVGPFQNLMTSIVPSSAGSEVSLLTPNSSEMDPFSMSSGAACAIFERMQNASNHDDVVPVLQELDSLSTRNPAVLHKFSDVLIPLVLSENDSCRNLAFTLVLKHITYCPSVNTSYLEVILQALQTSCSHLKDTLLDRIHEFVVLAQENAVVVLKLMFELGISTNINILPAINKSLALLRSQTGSS